MRCATVLSVSGGQLHQPPRMRRSLHLPSQCHPPAVCSPTPLTGALSNPLWSHPWLRGSPAFSPEPSPSYDQVSTVAPRCSGVNREGPPEQTLDPDIVGPTSRKVKLSHSSMASCFYVPEAPQDSSLGLHTHLFLCN